MGLIEKEKLIEDFKLLISRSFLGETTFCSQISIGEVCSLINDQPVINTESVRHGKWMPVGYNLYSRFYCSNCGWENGRPGQYPSVLYKYCPNCGSHMDEEVI